MGQHADVILEHSLIIYRTKMENHLQRILMVIEHSTTKQTRASPELSLSYILNAHLSLSSADPQVVILVASTNSCKWKPTNMNQQ